MAEAHPIDRMPVQMSAGDTALVLLFTFGDDYQRIVRQRSLEPERLQRRRSASGQRRN
jgi:hypothetical protein